MAMATPQIKPNMPGAGSGHGWPRRGPQQAREFEAKFVNTPSPLTINRPINL